MKILDFAMNVEKEAKELYEALALKAKEPELKRIFSLLAASEDEHHRAMESMKQGNTEAKADVAVLAEGKNVFRTLLQKEDLEQALAGDRDGFRHVMKAEEESIRTYEELAANTNDPAAKRLLNEIIEQEKEHLEVMVSIYDFVEAPRTYLEWQEFSNLGRL